MDPEFRSRRRPVPQVRTVLLLAALAGCASPRTTAPVRLPGNGGNDTIPGVGPRNGTLIVAGGGQLGPEIMDRFIDLAGGADASIVIIPTAGEVENFPPDWPGYGPFRRAGVRSVTVLHTRDRGVADSDSFAAPLRSATGVWIPGGRQWRLADAYLGTRTLRELFALLDRGGVIGGSSAGASIQASYMVRGAVEGNTIMMAPGHEEGFGFLRGVAVDQHLIARGRENDMLDVIGRHPELLGIGLDEGTAILVNGDEAEVIGRSKAAFYNTRDADGEPYYFLEAGDVFDLAGRRVRYGTRQPAQTNDERAALAAVQALFDAMRAADTAAIRALFHPDARLFVSSRAAGEPSLTTTTAATFIARIGSLQARIEERAFDPEIRVDDDLASVWTYYDLRLDGEFSHCGTDAFHLARAADGWKILGLSYTVRRQGCRR